MRIIHFEDEWAKTRSIAHRLHDRLFESLSPEKAIDLELSEEENPTGDHPSRIVVSSKGVSPKPIFEYVFVTEMAILKSMVEKEDIVIVDIMRSGQYGRFMSILDDVLQLFRSNEFSVDKWRFFSAYPENVPSDCELTGFTKRQSAELIEFLFSKIREHPPWT